MRLAGQFIARVVPSQSRLAARRPVHRPCRSKSISTCSSLASSLPKSLHVNPDLRLTDQFIARVAPRQSRLVARRPVHRRSRSRLISTCNSPANSLPESLHVNPDLRLTSQFIARVTLGQSQLATRRLVHCPSHPRSIPICGSPANSLLESLQVNPNLRLASQFIARVSPCQSRLVTHWPVHCASRSRSILTYNSPVSNSNHTA